MKPEKTARNARMYAAWYGGATYRRLAVRYSVSETTVARIVQREHAKAEVRVNSFLASLLVAHARMIPTPSAFK